LTSSSGKSAAAALAAWISEQRTVRGIVTPIFGPLYARKGASAENSYLPDELQT
jgi:hypothetical protein